MTAPVDVQHAPEADRCRISNRTLFESIATQGHLSHSIPFLADCKSRAGLNQRAACLRVKHAQEDDLDHSL